MGKISQQMMKSMHKKEIFTMISNQPGISRVQIASEMSLSKTTVSALVDELMQEAYVVDSGAMESMKQGRKPNGLKVNSEGQYLLVISCYQERLEGAVLNAAMDIREQVTIDVKQGLLYTAQISTVYRTLLRKKPQGGSVLGVCVIIPGIIDEEKNSIFSLVLPLEGEENVIDTLRRDISEYPLAILNDTACLAYAESIWGSMQGENGVYLNINQGVGAALISEGKMFRGANGMTTQFGHTSINISGAKCRCGNRGCLENEIGELALEKRIRMCGIEESFQGKDPVLFRDVGKLAMEGDEGVLQMLDSIVMDLSLGLNNLITLFHPKRIMIGGVGRKLGDIFLEKVRDSIQRTGFRQFVTDTEIEFTGLSEQAMLQGAGKYFMDMHFSFNETEIDKAFLY